MRPMDSDLLARIIRSQTQIPKGFRLEMLHAINNALRDKYQFFNSKRFLDMGAMTLDENERNDTTIQIKRDWWK